MPKSIFWIFGYLILFSTNTPAQNSFKDIVQAALDNLNNSAIDSSYDSTLTEYKIADRYSCHFKNEDIEVSAIVFARERKNRPGSFEFDRLPTHGLILIKFNDQTIQQLQLNHQRPTGPCEYRASDGLYILKTYSFVSQALDFHLISRNKIVTSIPSLSERYDKFRYTVKTPGTLLIHGIGIKPTNISNDFFQQPISAFGSATNFGFTTEFYQTLGFPEDSVRNEGHSLQPNFGLDAFRPHRGKGSLRFYVVTQDTINVLNQDDEAFALIVDDWLDEYAEKYAAFGEGWNNYADQLATKAMYYRFLIGLLDVLHRVENQDIRQNLFNKIRNTMGNTLNYASVIQYMATDLGYGRFELLNSE